MKECEHKEVYVDGSWYRCKECNKFVDNCDLTPIKMENKTAVTDLRKIVVSYVLTDIPAQQIVEELLKVIDENSLPKEREQIESAFDKGWENRSQNKWDNGNEYFDLTFKK